MMSSAIVVTKMTLNTPTIRFLLSTPESMCLFLSSYSRDQYSVATGGGGGGGVCSD